MTVRDSKEKFADYMREYRKKNPQKMKQIDLKKKFNISLEFYYSLLEAQGEVCVLCKQRETKIDPRSGLPFALAVDHCHKTGKVRGLLCMKCNRGLGLFEDNIDTLITAINYLKEI